ncbi:hypothetical protein D3C87_792080 [compost metagenome]
MRIGEGVGDFGGALADRVAEGLSPDFKRAFQHFLTRAQRSCERQRLIGHGGADTLQTGAQHGVERFGAAGNGFVDAGETFHQLAVEAAGALVEGAGELRHMHVEGRVDLAYRRLHALLVKAGAKIEIHDRIVSRALQALAEGEALFFKRRGQLVENRIERTADDLLAAFDIAIEFQRAVGQRLVELASAFLKRAVEAFHAAIQRRSMDRETLQQHFTALVQRRGEIMQAHVEFVGDRRARGVQRLEQVFGLGGDQAAHRFGRGARFFEQRSRTRVDHRGESLAGRGDPHRKLFADDGKLFFNLFLRADDGGADALGVIDDGVTLGGQFLHEAAHAQFIVGIAAFERVDFGMNEGFEFRRAGDCALDAVIHGRDFAAHRLTNGHDAVGRYRFGLGKTKGDFGHGAGGVPQIAGTRHHDREGEEQHDGNKDADDDCHQAGDSGEISQRGDVPERIAIEKMCDTKAAERPDDRHDRGVAQRAADGAAFQRFQDHGRAALGTVIGRFEIGRSGCLFGRRARGLGSRGLSACFLQSGLRLLRRCSFPRLRLFFESAKLQGIFQCLKCSLVDRVADLVIRHAVTPRYTYARLHAVDHLRSASRLPPSCQRNIIP